jgi:solute carrier family 25 folate transporter 32
MARERRQLAAAASGTVVSTSSRKEVTATDLVLSSMTSKYIATIITYPHEVLRARMQDARLVDAVKIAGPSSSWMSSGSTSSIRFMVMHIVRTEGIGSLWAGLRVNLVRVIPSTLSTFLCYEYMMRYLQNRYDT